MQVTRGKKVTTCVLCAAFALAMIVPAGAAFAGNWGDKYYSISSNGDGFTYTPARAKEDYTSSWDNCSSASETHTVQIACESSENGPIVAWPGPKATWWAGKADYLLNNVKESGFYWATLVIEGSPYVWANGYWSPDSI